MFRFQDIPPDGDPSGRIQEFRDLLPRLLCFRYWWMEEWKSQHMSFPYWRMYWNSSGKARVVYKNKIHLSPDRILLIPPNTPFSTDIEGSEVAAGQAYSLKGNRVESLAMEQEMIARDKVLHLFIHFNLGYPYDSISPGIFEFPVETVQRDLISSLRLQLIEGRLMFGQKGSLQIHALLFSLLQQLPASTWKNKILDPRIMDAIRHMERHIASASISNVDLAREARMSVNAFARLFREQSGYSPRKYLIRMRIEKASNLLHHSDMGIEEIAAASGFSDRYYFTKTFSKVMKVSPAAYRKTGGMGSPT